MTMLALFPLSQPLFPDSKFSLRVFEARYLNLIERCQSSGEPFGVVTLLEGNEVLTPGVTEKFSSVGCLAHVLEANPVEPGMLSVMCKGGQRFNVQDAQRDVLGLWRASVEMLPEDIAVDIPPDLQSVADRLGSLIAQSQRQGFEDRLPVSRPYRLDECGWVANQWANLINLDAVQKLEILQEDDPLARLTMVKLLLDHTGMK